MTPRFESFIGFVKKSETVYKKGHYGNDNFVVVERDPNDSGGTTKWGLDAKTHGQGVAKLSWPEAEQVYFSYYWTDGTSCESMPPGLGEVVFDTRINSGLGAASRLLSRTQDPAKFLDLRDERNRAIAQRIPKDKRYLDGWLNRTVELRKRLGL